MSDEALQLSFRGKLGLTLPNLAENPESMIIGKKLIEKFEKINKIFFFENF